MTHPLETGLRKDSKIGNQGAFARATATSR